MIYNDDCLNVLKSMADNSVDAVVTDPPYGLSFMGKHWDYDVPDIAIWAECLRVLKPGGHLLSFAGTRTYHRMAVRIEDAGFEIRDMIAWVYGSGFPKSLNIGKAVDKINGEIGRLIKFVKWYRTTGMRQKETNEIIGKADVGSHYLRLDQPSIPTMELWKILRPHIKVDIPKWVDELVERIEREREVIGKGEAGFLEKNFVFELDNKGYGSYDLTKGTSEWEGWGTALKPALEPITVARKPLEGTVAENCLKWGTGGLNVDGCRVEGKLEGDPNRISKTDGGWGVAKFHKPPLVRNNGRWPANLIHDGSDEVLELFPQTKSGKGQPRVRKTGLGEETTSEQYSASGSAARFFYCAKASKRERNRGCEELPIPIENLQGLDTRGRTLERADGSKTLVDRWKGSPTHNNHPTVKPVALMEYLVKLISREGQTVLDPFMGSGTTGIACRNLNREFIGIEKDKEYFEIAKSRINEISDEA